MARKRYTAEQIIGHLRQAEIRISEGKTLAEVVRELGVSEQTYYRWRKEYGGMKVAQLRRLSERGLPGKLLSLARRRSCTCVRRWPSPSVGRVVCWGRCAVPSDTRSR